MQPTAFSAAQLPREVPMAKRKAPPVAAAVKDRAKQSLVRWVKLARERFNHPLFMPTISFDLTGTTAGKAYTKQRHIQLNAILLTENEDRFDKDTIPHELAHLLAFHVLGYSGAHGEPWQEAMHKLGLEPRRTHNMDVTNARTTKSYTGFACGCGPTSLSAKFYKSFRRGRRVICQTCKQAVRQVGVVEVVGGGKMPTPAPAPATRPANPPAMTPRRNEPPPIAPTTPGRPPSDAMLRFATSLAEKHGLSLPLAVRTDFGACRVFLDQWSKAPVAPRAPAATPVPSARPPAPAAVEPPTERQVAYAKSIAARKRVDIPEDVLRSKAKMSQWIDANK